MQDEKTQELFFRVTIRSNLLVDLKEGWLREYHLDKFEKDFSELIIHLTKTAQYDILNQIKKNLNKEE
jgi:hypothetical protein